MRNYKYGLTMDYRIAVYIESYVEGEDYWCKRRLNERAWPKVVYGKERQS